MSTSSKEAKVNSILLRKVIPETARKVKYLWQNVNDIRMSVGKIHSCKQRANRTGDLAFGNQKMFSIPKNKFISTPKLKLQFTGTATPVVKPDIWGAACIESIKIEHNTKLMEYYGENLTHLLMHYAKDDAIKTNIVTELGGAGGNATAIVYTAYVPIYIGQHPAQMYGKFQEPYYTGLMDSTLDITVTFKSAANSLSTPDTVTAFNTCDLQYLDYWGEPLELNLANKNYSRLMYDLKYFRQSIPFVATVEKAVDISSIANDDVEVHDIIFQMVTDANWSTAKNYNQGTAPTNYRFNVSGNDWYKSSEGSDVTDFNDDYLTKYARAPNFTQTAASYFFLADPYMHEAADNYSSTLDEQIMTPGCSINQLSPTLYITIATATYWLIITCLRKRIVKYDGNFIQQIFNFK